MFAIFNEMWGDYNKLVADAEAIISRRSCELIDDNGECCGDCDDCRYFDPVTYHKEHQYA